MEIPFYCEDGIIALVNSDTYKTFVDEDWSFDQLMAHFVSEMNQNHCIVLQVSNEGGGDYNIKLMPKPSETESYREFQKQIHITNNKMYVVNYTNLTMAAQFKDTTIPSETTENWFFELENGLYSVLIRQMFDPYVYDDEEQEGIFEIIPTKINDNISEIPQEQLFWYDIRVPN